MKDAYIYTRVSKKTQAADGEGLERQKTNTEQYIEGLRDYKLSGTYTDEGVSSFYGKNLKEGSGLFQFFADVDDGKVEEDSLLVIEGIDRLTRLPSFDAREEIVKILKKKINIGIAKWNVVIWHDQKQGELSSEILLTAGIYLAHMESEQKSKRIKSTIKIRQDRARNGGPKRTGVCPAWLYLSKDRTQFLEDEDKVKIVQRIYRMNIYDRLGNQSIAKKLNEEGVKPIGKSKKWGLTAIANILKNIAVTGKFQPMSRTIEKGKRIDTPYGEIINDYYPRILSDEDFKLAQDVRIKKHSVSSETLQGRTAGYKNLFRHLTVCYKCNSPMSYKNRYLACGSIHCNAKYAVYKKFEDKLLKFFKGADFLQLASKVDVEEISKQQEEIKNLEVQISELESSNDNLLDTIQSTNNNQVRDLMLERLENNNAEINKLRDKVNKIDVIQANTEDLCTDIDLDDIYQREKYNALLRKSVKYIKYYEGYIFVCLKTNPYEEGVFHTDALGFMTFRDLKEEPDLLTFLEDTSDFMKIYKAITVLDRQKKEGLTWKQTNRILREHGLQEHYELYAKKIYKELNPSEPVTEIVDFSDIIEGSKPFEVTRYNDFNLEDLDSDTLSDIRKNLE